MGRGWCKPLGILLGGILCIHASAFAAETDTKKSSAPVKKAKEAAKAEAKSETQGETKSTAKVETKSG